ncbi:MAG: hypothetical protein RJA46_550 [Pseudomonadota bacterium]
MVDTQQQAQLNGGKDIKIEGDQQLHRRYRTTIAFLIQPAQQVYCVKLGKAPDRTR